MSRFLVRLTLGLLTTVAVVLPFMLNKQNYDPALKKAQAAVQQTQDRAEALEAAIDGSADAAPKPTEAEPAASAPVVQPGRLRDTLDKLNRQQQELADQ